MDGKVVPDTLGTRVVTTARISKSAVQVLQNFGYSLLCLQQETENRRGDTDINRFNYNGVSVARIQNSHSCKYTYLYHL